MSSGGNMSGRQEVTGVRLHCIESLAEANATRAKEERERERLRVIKCICDQTESKLTIDTFVCPCLWLCEMNKRTFSIVQTKLLS